MLLADPIYGSYSSWEKIAKVCVPGAVCYLEFQYAVEESTASATFTQLKKPLTAENSTLNRETRPQPSTELRRS